MLKIFFVFISTLLLFLFIDAAWISVFGSKWYAEYLSHLTSGKVAIVPALLFYTIYIGGMVYFVIHPALHNSLSLSEVFFR